LSKRAGARAKFLVARAGNFSGPRSSGGKIFREVVDVGNAYALW